MKRRHGAHPLEISIPGQAAVSAVLDLPRRAEALLALAHGAGAGMSHPAMEALAKALNDHSLATLRYQFSYMERGSKRPDRTDIAVAAVAAASRRAAELVPDLPLFAGGRSFGGRMTTTAAARSKIPQVRGIIAFAFPLHPANQPSLTRAEHLTGVRLPTLLIQGTRDALADLRFLRKVVAGHRSFLRLHTVKDADHAFAVRKSSGRLPAEVLEEIAAACLEFCRSVAVAPPVNAIFRSLLINHY